MKIPTPREFAAMTETELAEVCKSAKVAMHADKMTEAEVTKFANNLRIAGETIQAHAAALRAYGEAKFGPIDIDEDDDDDDDEAA